jgi:asparagine synthase (glutamine-hydrolysing)
MCGIFGIMQHRASRPPDEGRLRETVRLMRHRGPDGEAIYTDVGIGLAHTRLSLVDLSERSSQPFWDRTRRYCLVYNGELYDYGGLKAQLERLGTVFRTTSDTEVLLEALIRWGVEKTLPQLEGMFAFGFYDAQEQRLVVARDRFGIKPLHVVEDDDLFAFASTVRALRPWHALRPDLLSVSSYLHGFGGPTTGNSFYEHVKIVPPGSILSVRRGGRAEFARYFALGDLADAEQAESLARLKPVEFVDRVEEALLAGVKSQLCADAPVGAMCSGGVDSSLVVAMAARIHPDLTVFHADVVGPLSECSAAARVARHLNVNFRTIPVQDHHFVENMPAVMEHIGIPFARLPHAIPIALVSQLARSEGVKAVLCGEGADECFLGYPWLLPNVRAMVRQFPGQAYRTASFALRNWERKIRGKGPRTSFTPRDRQLLAGLYHGFELELGPDHVDAEPAILKFRDPRKVSLASDAELSYGLRGLLHRNDTMGMAASIEARFPFLDSRVARLATNLPYRSKVRFSPWVFDWQHPFFRDKWVLRKVADRYLPADLSQRKKRGLPTNAFQRLRIADSYFLNSYTSNLFQLHRAATRHLLTGASYALKLRLLHLDLWGQVCIEGRSPSDVGQGLRSQVAVAA